MSHVADMELALAVLLALGDEIELVEFGPQKRELFLASFVEVLFRQELPLRSHFESRMLSAP